MSAAGEGELIEERHGRISILRINRPEARNAMTRAIRSGIGRALATADADPDVLVTIITGTGERAFCAGADLRGMASSGITTEMPAGEAGLDAYTTFVREGVAKPVICAANGAAVGGGFELLLACDLVVAAEHATFGLPEAKRGLLPSSGGTHLGLRIPQAIALEMGLTGDPIDARRAEALGLVNRVVPASEVLTAAVELAQRVADNGPLAVRAVKRLMRTAVRGTAAEAWELQDEIRPAVAASDDAREGVRAFVEKRRPDWSGT